MIVSDPNGDYREAKLTPAYVDDFLGPHLIVTCQGHKVEMQLTIMELNDLASWAIFVAKRRTKP